MSYLHGTLPVCFGEPNESKWRKISSRVSSGWCSGGSSAGTEQSLTHGWWLRAQDWHPPCGPLTAQRSNSQWPMAAPRKNCKRNPAKGLESLISDCFSYSWNLGGRQVMSYPGVALSSCKLQFLSFDWVQGQLSTPLGVGQWKVSQLVKWWN